MSSCVIVYGSSGNGKTYTSRILSKTFNFPLIPMDHVIDFVSESVRKKFGNSYPDLDFKKIFQSKLFQTKKDFNNFSEEIDELISENKPFFKDFYESFIDRKKPGFYRHLADPQEQKKCVNLGECGLYLEPFAKQITKLIFKYIVKDANFFIIEGDYFTKGSDYRKEIELRCKEVYYLGCFYRDIYEFNGVGLKNIKILKRKLNKITKQKKRKPYQSFSEIEEGDSLSYEKLKKIGLPNNLSEKKVLDLGCNEGFFCFECEKRGAQVIGIEKDEYWYNKAIERKEKFSSSVRIENKDWNFISLLKQKFDLVLFLGAFHYLKNNQLEILTHVYNLLHEGGLLILEAGLLDKNEGKFLIENVKRPVGDARQFTNKFTIQKLLKNAGFNQVLFFGGGLNIKGDDVPRYIIHAKKDGKKEGEEFSMNIQESINNSGLSKLHLPSNFESCIELTSDEESQLEKNIIWLFGHSGDGIMRLSSKLLSHQTCLWNEPKIGPHLNTITNLNGKIISVFENWQKIGKKPKYDYLFFNGFKNTWKFYLRKLILNRIKAQFQDITKKIIIKEADSFAPDILSDLFPNSKIIILLQDGRAFVKRHLYINSKKGSSAIHPIPFSVGNPKSIVEELSILWNDTTGVMIKAYENHNENLRFLIKIEDLQKNTLEILEKIYKFAEIDVTIEELKKLIDAHGYTNNQEKWKSWKYTFTDEEKTSMENIMLKKLQKLGYRSLD